MKVHTCFLREAIAETELDRQEIYWGKQLKRKKEEAGIIRREEGKGRGLVGRGLDSSKH